MKTALFASTLALALGAAAIPAQAGGPPISVQFTIGTPPPVYAPAPVYTAPVMVAPSMIWMPEMGAYVALQVQDPLFFVGGVYYLFSNGIWLSGPHYGGPWRRMEGPPPPALRRFRSHEWNHVQERAERYSRDPRWAHFRAGPQVRPESHVPGGRPGEMQRPQPGRPGNEGRPQQQQRYQQQYQQQYQHQQQQRPGERRGQSDDRNNGRGPNNRPYGPNGN